MTDEEYEKYVKSQEACDVALKMRLEIEQKLDPNQFCILDRSLIDALAYGVEFKSSISDAQRVAVKKHVAKYIYKQVYHLGLVPLEKDNVRLTFSEEERQYSQKIFFTQYASLGYLPIRVGRLSDDKIESIKRRIELVAPTMQEPIRTIRYTSAC